jgi:O-antigen/teichoic acid export membrane protein
MEALPFFAYTVLGQIFFLIALMAARLLVGPEQMGQYAAAVRLMMALVPFSQFVIAALIPLLGASRNTGIRATVKYFLVRCMVFSLPLIAVGSFEASALLRFTLGHAYLPAAPMFSILLYALPLLGAALLAGAALNQMGRAKGAMIAIVGVVIFQFPLAWLCTRFVGGIGTAVATSIAVFVCAIALCAMIEGLLKECGLTLLAIACGAPTVHFLLFEIVSRISWLANDRPRFVLDALVICGYFLALRSLASETLSRVRRVPSGTPTAGSHHG